MRGAVSQCHNHVKSLRGRLLSSLPRSSVQHSTDPFHRPHPQHSHLNQPIFEVPSVRCVAEPQHAESTHITHSLHTDPHPLHSENTQDSTHATDSHSPVLAVNPLLSVLTVFFLDTISTVGVCVGLWREGRREGQGGYRTRARKLFNQTEMTAFQSNLRHCPFV